MVANAVLVNFSAGETSPRSRGRFDAPWYVNAARKMLNFIAEVQGPARFRPGIRHVRTTRRGQTARLLTFQISNTLAYELEFTPLFMRAYKNGDIITTQPTTLTAVTRANPAVITVASAASLSNGDEIIIQGVVGMLEINNRQFVLANKSGSTFQLTDPVTGTNINSTNWAAWSSGGTINKITEIASPYAVTDFSALQFASSNAVGYFVDGHHAAYKITVDAADVFTLGTYSRTNDPFVAGTPLVVTNVHLATDTQINFAAGTVFNSWAIYTFAAVVGTVEINGGTYRLVQLEPGSTNAYIRNTTTGAAIDSTAWTAYASGGTATPDKEYPVAVGFYEGRLGFFGTNQRPDCIFLSRSPDSSGNSRYDDFTGGTNADHACFFQLASTTGTVNQIAWARGGLDHLFIGSFGGPFRVSGSGLDIPISPSSINVRQFDFHGCAAAVAAGTQQVFFIQRGGTTVRSIKVINPYLATFESQDMCLNAEQVMYSALQRIILQTGRPDVLWALRADGILAGLSVNIAGQEAQALGGWHRHQIGGVAGQVLDLAVQQRSTGLDQLWAVTQRTINGATRCAVEILSDDVVFPDPEDYFSGSKNHDADLAAFQGAVYRAQANCINMDAAATYDGSTRGVTAAATLTPGTGYGTVDSSVTFTAGASVFTAADVGAELWQKPDPVTGLGGGRASITAYTSGTQVTAKILAAFNSGSAIAAGNWFFAVSKIYGMAHLEGATVAVVTDGAVYSDGGQTGDSSYPTVTVLYGAVTLTQTAAVIQVGLPYLGFLETHNLEIGGKTGPAQDKPRTISGMYIRFMNSLGVEYGTDYYSLSKVENRLSDAVADRPAPVFSGIRKLVYQDSTSGLNDATREKRVVVAQRLPLPAVVQFIDVHYDATDEN